MNSTYSIQKETEVFLEYDYKLYSLDALGGYTFAQTYNKKMSARKTLHYKASKPLTLITAKNPGSASLDVLLTDTYIESILLRLLGLEESPSGYELPSNLLIEPKYFTLHIISGDTTHRLTKCVLTNLDMAFSKGSPLLFSVGLEFSDLIVEHSLPLSTEHIQGNHFTTSNILEVYVGTEQLHSLQNTSFSVQQQFDWRQDRSIHSIGLIHTSTVAILSEMPINSVITAYATKNLTIPDILYNTTIGIKYGPVTIKLQDVILAKRLVVGDVFSEQFDISLQETSSVIVEYGAIT